MKFNILIPALVTVSFFLSVTPTFAQEETAATLVEPQTDEYPGEDTSEPTGQEVEINEDNYRQFMELKDARQQRGVFPETTFKPQTGNQKLDELPEESQKHLRNQLREIIVQGDPWQPGDEYTEYPYTPSDAAKSKPSLKKMETEAWGELVGAYHQREAQIHANTERLNAAADANGTGEGAAGSPMGGTQGQNGGEPGSSGQQGSSNQQSAQQRIVGQSGSPGSHAPEPPNNDNIKNSAGVSQNAMEFLKNQSTSSGSSNSAETADSAGSSWPNNAASSAPPRAAANSSDVTPPVSSSNTQITAKLETAQNALEFLIGEKAAEAVDPEQDTDSDIESGTISIDDLLNVQGVRGASTPGLSVPPANEVEVSQENLQDKDG